MKQTIEHWRPNKATKIRLDQATDILDEYAEMDLTVTLRQLFYQFVSRFEDFDNTLANYRSLGNILTKGRRGGFINWNHLCDLGRRPRDWRQFKDIAELLQWSRDVYRIDMWEHQPVYVEVMLEKEALSGVLEDVCSSNHVVLNINKGYSSTSAMYEAATRMHERANYRDIHVLYLGDHDASGLDMLRDVEDRLIEYTVGANITVHHVALTFEQTQEHDLIANYTKELDARAKPYLDEFGEDCWELDALEPGVLQELLTEEIDALMDDDQWNKDLERQNEDKEKLGRIASRNRRKLK
jgi:hypothetical protein